jgi:hypothetical protein
LTAAGRVSKKLRDPIDVAALAEAELPDEPTPAIEEILASRTAKPYAASRSEGVLDHRTPYDREGMPG